MKRIVAVLMVLALLLLSGCGLADGRATSNAGTGPVSAQDTIDPVHEARTLDESSAEEIPLTAQPESSSGNVAAQAPPPEEISPADNTESSTNEVPPEEYTESSEADLGTTLNGAEPSLFDMMQPAIGVGEFETELLRLINEERSGSGIEPLGLEENMQWAARIRAAEVLNSLSHTRPDGSPYYTAFDEAGFVYAGKWHGENVSSMSFLRGTYDSEGAAAKMFEELKDSPGHYLNMLSDNFSQVGVGVYVLDNGDTVQIGCVQLFASF